MKTEAERFVFFESELRNAIVQNMVLAANDVLSQTSEEVSLTFNKMN
jgi:type VI protein secretion system component Hcp